MTGDTAKILDQNSREGVHFHLETQVSQTSYALWVQYGKVIPRQDFGRGDSTIPVRLDAPTIILPPNVWQQEEPPQPTHSWQSPYYHKAALEAN